MRILIIDDNPLDIELVSRMLKRRLGAEVESVHTAEEGRRRLLVEEFDVVLLDYFLPGRNGIDFLKTIAKDDIHVPIIVVSAVGDERVEHSALEAGAVDYLSKEESLSPALIRAIVAASERGRADRAVRERDRAERLRRKAELIIGALERRVNQLEASIGAGGAGCVHTAFDELDERKRLEVEAELIDRYRAIVRKWIGTPAEGREAREMLGSLVADMFRYGFGAEQLVGLHWAACQDLRDERLSRSNKHGKHGKKGARPRMLLVEAALALLDAYRRAALSRDDAAAAEASAQPSEHRPEA